MKGIKEKKKMSEWSMVEMKEELSVVKKKDEKNTMEEMRGC